MALKEETLSEEEISARAWWVRERTTAREMGVQAYREDLAQDHGIRQEYYEPAGEMGKSNAEGTTSRVGGRVLHLFFLTVTGRCEFGTPLYHLYVECES